MCSRKSSVSLDFNTGAAYNEVGRIVSVLCKVGVMEGEKEILCQMGLDFGKARMPFSELNEEQKSLIRREITDKL